MVVSDPCVSQSSKLCPSMPSTARVFSVHHPQGVLSPFLNLWAYKYSGALQGVVFHTQPQKDVSLTGPPIASTGADGAKSSRAPARVCTAGAQFR